MKDRYLTVRETAEQVEINADSSHAILCGHVQSGSEVCSQASVRGTEKLPIDKQDYKDLRELCKQYGLEELSLLISDPPLLSKEYTLRESGPRLRKHSDQYYLHMVCRAQGLENISLPFSLDAEIVEVEIEVVSPSIVPSGNFAELKSYCHLYGAQGQRQAYL
ncbi:hypothetical protein TNCV_3146971 [Trichonephila clavipes]|nr:hypothetical protein TNCV_3146971 [Trichonephila clavipes]